MATAGADLPIRRFRRARGLVLVVVALAGGAATTLAWSGSDREQERRDQVVADRAIEVLEGIVVQTQAGLSGADGLVDASGNVALAAFEAYGRGVVAATTLEALAFEPVVAAADRPAFEAALGRPIVDRPGATSPAPLRDEHLPVLSVVPVLDTNRAVLGFDIAADPVRHEAALRARDSGLLVFSEPVPSQPSGRLSFFLCRAIYRANAPVDTPEQRRAAVVGYLSTAYGAEVLTEELTRGLPRGSRFEVRDGDTVLAASRTAPRGSSPSTTVQVTGRPWVVTVGSAEGPDRGVAALMGGTTILLVLGLGYLLHRTDRYDRSVDRSARHLQALAGFAGGLATRGSSDDVMTYLTSGVLAPLEAFHAAVGVVEGDLLRRYFTPGPLADAARAALPATNPLVADTPLTESARTDTAVLLPSTDAMRRRYPHLAEAWEAASFGATANIPLHDRSGAVIGALGVAWDHPVDFDADLLDRLATVAGIAGQTLERALQGDAEHRLVGALQRDVLAPLPEAPGLVCAARYLPAARTVGMGGDWFEGIVLDDGRYVVVVGDIAGHGITAVGQMAQFRSMLGTLVRIGTPLDQVVERASRSVEGTGRIATAVVVAIDAAAGTLEYVAAGHPPPILRLPDGSTVLLSEGRRPLIGVTKPSVPAGSHPFPVGATVFCYTDGLIERRGEAIDRSVQQLADRVAALAPGDPAAMADQLLAACLPDQEQTDDVALAVLTRRP